MKNIYKEIYKKIEEYDNIVIARHIRIDPDAMASQVALRQSIRETFPNKKVFAIGNGTIRFNYIGRLDKIPTFEENEKVLLIVCDTPDKKRIDLLELGKYDYCIKIDHHPFIETFGELELIDDTKSSASEMIYDVINNTKLVFNKKIAEILFYGIVADTNRFLFNNASASTFTCVSDMITKTNLDITKCYANLYTRPFKEMELLGYMISNMKITDNGVGYVKIEENIISKYQDDSLSSGDLINEFNNVNELLVWMTAIEDVKNSCIKISLRSRGPQINKIAEHFGGGGHALASGARVSSFEDVDELIKALDKECKKFIEKGDLDED